jgi:hypothetical protein
MTGRRRYGTLGVLIALAVTAPAGAAGISFDAAALLSLAGGTSKALTVISDESASTRQAVEAFTPFRLEAHALQQWLQPGWHRLTLRVRVPTAPHAADELSFAVGCPSKVRDPETFHYETAFAPAEFPPPGRYGELTRTLYLGPSFGNYGMVLQGFKGLRVESLRLEPLARSLILGRVRTNKLLYGLRESGTAAVYVYNASGGPLSGRLTVTVESGLDDRALLFDRQVSFAGGTSGQPDVVEIALPPQPDYGHAVVATLSQGEAAAQTTRDYFYTTDRPAMVGHLGTMGIDAAYGIGSAGNFVERLRRFCFPMYEIDFWAPDDVLGLVPPPGKDRWWSGQTLARMTTDSLKERIRLGQAQGMKVLAYTNLRYDFGFRIAESFRRRPEFCEWDASTDQGYSVSAIRRQARADDAERFDPSAPNKAKFNAQGVWRLASGNPDVVDAHVDQLVRSIAAFGWDGWRYDDRYNYDEPAVDLLGRQLPRGGWRNPAIVARIRAALERAKPGSIYGHNLEWAQDQPARAVEPMPLDTPPHPDDYYTEFLRDGGLHLQERWTAHMVQSHASWVSVRDELLALGHNAYRRGGYAYGLSYVNGARPTDARHLAALHFAGLTHLAGGVHDANLGQMRLACRHADLLYGDRIVPLPASQQVLQVDSGGRAVWWQHYVRYRELAPGRRVYFVHLINPPRGAKIGEGDPNPPDPVTDMALTWKLPAGWKAVRAFQLSGEGDTSVETVVSSGAWARQCQDLSGFGTFHVELPARTEGDATRLIVPKLEIWSIVALECSGPESDAAPDVRFPLPPLPPTDADLKWEPATGNSPFRTVLVYDAPELWKAWMVPDATAPGKLIALEKLHPGDGSAAQAPECVDGWQMKAYRPGQSVEGGLYRVSFRVLSAVEPPPNARLEFSAWCPPRRKPAWRSNQSVPLDGLRSTKSGGAWQTFTRDVELGYGWENFGLEVKGGFPGLAIGQIKIEEVRRQPDSERLKVRELPGWPPGLTLTPHDGLRVWLGDGLYTEHYQLESAFKALPNVTLTRAEHWVFHDTRGFDGASWTKPEDLSGYDLIVLSNVDLRTLSLSQRDWLRGYVEAGGSLWLLGGPYGLGRGGWQNSDLIEPLLPAKLHDYDLRPATTPLQLRAAGGFLADEWSDRPVTLWLHEVEPKPGSTVHLKAGDRPALVTATAGKGRVAVLAITPLGDVPAGALAWWQWPAWEQVMTKTAAWLLKKG